MIRYRLAVIALLSLLWSAPPARAQAPDQEPLRIVRQIYAPYIADKLGKGGALDLIRPHAAPELQRLIDRENACTRRNRGLCAIDYDPVVDGQDFQIKGLVVTAVNARPGAMVARASFRNMNRPTVVDYAFTLIAGRWFIADVVIRDGNRRLSTTLKTNP